MSEVEIIKRLEARRYAAMLAADVDELEQILAPGLVYTHSDASRDSRTSYLGKVASRQFDYLRIEHDEEDIRIVGDCAVVVGQMRGVVNVGAKTLHLDNSCTAVWVRSGQDWRLLTYTPTVNR